MHFAVDGAEDPAPHNQSWSSRQGPMDCASQAGTLLVLLCCHVDLASFRFQACICPPSSPLPLSKQELNALIKYVQNNKASDNDWFLIESNKTGTCALLPSPIKGARSHAELFPGRSPCIRHGVEGQVLVRLQDGQVRIRSSVRGRSLLAMFWVVVFAAVCALRRTTVVTESFSAWVDALLARVLCPIYFSLMFSVYHVYPPSACVLPCLRFHQIPVSYPTTPFEIVLPELEGKTPKMYRGGKICLSLHFKPLWSKNVPHFGIAHALAMGLGPWLAAEIPYMVDQGIIAEKSNSDMSKSAEKK